tara:strand:+ start:524 stop:1549 length:1026 start_codon:yes stop_codon:yes gene_type:complete
VDSVTQILLGATVGYVVSSKHFGKKSLIIGGIAGVLPDLDFLPFLPINDSFLYLKYHRSLSHSLLFCVTAPFLIAYLWQRLSVKPIFWTIYGLFFWGFFTHSLLDCFTSWGTQIFWPFPYRVAWNSIFIVDLFYTLPLLISIIACYFVRTYQRAQRWIIRALVVSSTYLLLSVGIKMYINTQFEALFHKHAIQWTRYTSRPSPFNLILWSATAETASGYYYGMVSLFDRALSDRLFFTPKKQAIPAEFSTKKTQELLSYTKGFYTIEKQDHSILIHDLRYGFLGDPWLNNPQFVFSYLLSPREDGLFLTIINPRPKNTTVLLHQLWFRLKGLPQPSPNLLI